MRIFKPVVYYCSWAVTCIAMFVFTLHPSQELALWILGMFAIVEVVAVLDSDKGDTFSELIWGFYAGQPARAAIVIAVVIYMCAVVSYIFTGWEAWMVLAKASVVAGLGTWLLWHFLKLGRDG
jgi:hypothetical protein